VKLLTVIWLVLVRNAACVGGTHRYLFQGYICSQS
jgi:hypothetical protein